MIWTGRTCVTPPAEEPVSKVEAKKHVREDGTDQDVDVIEPLIVAAREVVEDATWMALLTQTWDVFYAGFPSGGDPFNVPLPPLQSVTSVKYYDTDGNQQTLASANYTVDTSRTPGRIRAAYDTTWPETRDMDKAVEVRIVAGYKTPGSVPRKFRQAMLFLIAHWYAHRESVVVGTISVNVQRTFDSLVGTDHARAMIA